MSINVRDIMKLSSLKKIKIVAGHTGLSKSIKWVYVAECLEDPVDSVTWLQGGELVLISGVGIKRSRTKHDKDILSELVRGISEKNGAGLIVNVGPYIEKIPEEVMDEADQLGLPIFELPWEVKLVEITHEICSAIVLSEFEDNSLTYLLSNILFGEGVLEDNIIQRAAYLGYDLKGACQVCIIDIDGFGEYLKKSNTVEEAMIVKIKLQFMKLVQDALDHYHIKALYLAKSDSIIILHKIREKHLELIQQVFVRIQESIKGKWENMSVSMGIGNVYGDLELMKRSLAEAEWALKAVKIRNQNGQLVFYKDIGLYTLLFNIQDKEVLKQYYLDSLGSILEYDKINDSCLTATLETYLEQNCNITTTSQMLFLHRNTLKYRLKKIEELLGCDLHDLSHCTKLQLALEVGKILK